MLFGTLILYRTGSIGCFHPLVGSFEIRSVAALITQRPDNDARMVIAALHVTPVAFYVGFQIHFFLCQCRLTVTHSVRLDIGFRHYINTVAVAQFVPIIVVGIVTGSHGIDIVELHQLNILKHSFARHHITAVRVYFMAVCAFNQHRLSVDKQLCIFDFHLTEPHLQWHYFRIAERSAQRIEVRRFCRPFFRVLHLHHSTGLARTLYRRFLHRISVGIKQFQQHFAAAFQIQFHCQRTVAVIGIQIRRHANIVDALLVACIQVAVACHTAITEKVLVFQIRSVAPAEHLKSYQVLLSRLHISGNVKLRFQFAVLAVAHKLAVHPKIHVGSDGTEMRHDVLTVPIGRHYDFTPI